ncbi:MAG: NAD(P)H-dependent oxidoreductase subunit E [bacterium]
MLKTQTHTDEHPLLKSVPSQSTADLCEEIALLTAKLGVGPTALVPMLRELRLSRGSIPECALEEIADALGLRYGRVHMVASFYNRLDRGTAAA